MPEHGPVNQGIRFKGVSVRHRESQLKYFSERTGTPEGSCRTSQLRGGTMLQEKPANLTCPRRHLPLAEDVAGACEHVELADAQDVLGMLVEVHEKKFDECRHGQLGFSARTRMEYSALQSLLARGLLPVHRRETTLQAAFTMLKRSRKQPLKAQPALRYSVFRHNENFITPVERHFLRLCRFPLPSGPTHSCKEAHQSALLKLRCVPCHVEQEM